MMHGRRKALRLAPVLAVLLLATGCASTRLQKNAFEGRTLAATAAYPPEARVRHPLMAAAGRATFGPARDELKKVQRLAAVLKAATRRLDLPARIAGDMVLAGAPALGVTVIDDPKTADYVLDLRVYDYGLVMRPYMTTARFYIEAEAVMWDRAAEKVVWRERLQRTSSLKLDVTEASVADLTEADMEQVLAEFAAFASERMTTALRKDIR